MKTQGQIQYKTKGFKPKKLVIALIIFAIIAASLVAGWFYYRSLNRYTFKEDARFYVNGIEYTIRAGEKAVIQDDNSVNVGENYSVSSGKGGLPLFFNNRKAILLVSPMSYYSNGVFDSKRGYSLEVFTELEINQNNVIISKNGKNAMDYGAFLFDGNNTYVLLSEATLSIGNEEIALTPMSYVIASYDSWVMYYDYDSDTFEYIVFESEEDKSVTISFEDITVFCDLDRAESDGNNYMLTPAITMLPKFL